MAQRLLLVFSTIFKFRGGIQRFNQMLCMAIDDLAEELDLGATVISQDDTLADYRESGRTWKHLEFVPGGSQIRLTLRALESALRQRPDLVIIGLPGMSPVGALCAPFSRGGFGFIAHGTDVWEEPRRSRRLAMRRARFAFAVSRHTAESLRRLTGLPAEVIRLLPNTLDPSFDLSPETAPVAGAGPPELLTVSRLWTTETMKGVDHTLEAFARLAERHPRAVYRIVGKGPDKPRLEQLAADLGVAERVRFEQDLSDADLAARYRDCAAFVLPSGQEGFGIVFLEAMRFARPCVGGRAGGTPDVIVDGETGFLVPFDDRDALTAALDRLLSDPELRDRLGRAGRTRLEERFTFGRFRERVAGHLRELLPTAARR
jgi:glycosyltransferase involved in cell wall biosynthesis